MKFLSALLISASFTLAAGAELLINGDFESGNLDHWYPNLKSKSDTIKPKTFNWGTDVYFILKDGGAEKWDAQMWQPIVVRAGYRYTITMGGTAIEGAKQVNFGICHNGDSSARDGDGSGVFTGYSGALVTLPDTVYTEFKAVWDDTATNDSHARVYIDGGGDDIDFSIAWISVWESPIDIASATGRLTQLGFFTDGSKRIVVKNVPDSSFQIRDGANATVYTGTLGASSLWSPSGENVRLADFSSLKNNGLYALFCSNKKIVDSINISSNPLEAIGRGALKAFYYQRASSALAAPFAGAWTRPAGHPDTLVYIHSSAGSGKISAPKGWYDAGDYGKYIVNSGITVYTLLALYEHFPAFSSALGLAIPESGNNIPDILNEARWNLEWMRSMQAPDGGVYSKLTSLQFDSIIMPDRSTAKRYAFMKTTPASLDFAAVMAMSSRIYRPLDGPFADQCLDAAKKAYAWADAHPSVKYVQPPDCNTGEYGDEVFSDEFFWASAELALAAGSGDYSRHTVNPMPAGDVPSWQKVSTLGLYTMLTNMQAFPSALTDSAKARVIAAADVLLSRQKSGYGVSMTNDEYYWGSNHVAASQGILLLYAYYLTGKIDYRAGAEQQVDYLLGRNPLGECFVTGFGVRSPLHPHHRISQSDSVSAPVPGLLVGGPNPGNQDSVEAGKYADKPATSWIDEFWAYASNEVAINWNTTLAYCVNALEALHNGYTVSGFKKNIPTPALDGSALQRKIRMTLVVRENALVFRVPAHKSGACGGKFLIYDISGKQITSRPLAFGPRRASEYHSIAIPSSSIAKGCIIARIEEAGGAAMQERFVVW